MRVGIVILPEDRWWAAEPKWRAAEEYGFDHAWTYDHLGWRNLVDGPWFGAVPTLSAAAMVTSHIGLGTFVTSPNFRHPLPLMRDVITLDDLSDGRFIVGVGAGGTGYDTTVFDEPELTPAQRADRFVEFTTTLDGLLRTDGYEHSGEYYTVRGARNLPGAVQHPRPPFVIAANGPRTIDFAARSGEAWLTTGRSSEEIEEWWKGVAELAARADEALAAEERDPATLDRYLSLDAAPVYSLTSKEAFADAAGRAAELGFTDVVVHWPRSGSPYQGREVVLEEVVDDVLPVVQERPEPEPDPESDGPDDPDDPDGGSGAERE